MKRILYIIVLIYMCAGSNSSAQRIDSVYADTLRNPNRIFIRIALPDTGYRLTTAYCQNLLSYPPIFSMHLYFLECAGNPSLRFDTLLDLDPYIMPYKFWLWVGKDANTANPSCFIRTQVQLTDTFMHNYFGNLSVNNVQAGKRFEAYPNPASDKIEVIDHDRLLSSATLTNMQGQLIYQKSISGNKAIIPVKDYPPGLYLLRVKTTDGELFSDKVLIN